MLDQIVMCLVKLDDPQKLNVLVTWWFITHLWGGTVDKTVLF